MFGPAVRRSVRCFNVYRGSKLVLMVEDRPGVLLSTAASTPEGAPAHPFVHAQAYDALRETELAEVLRRSHSFDSYVENLISSGYDVMSCHGTPCLEVGEGVRIVGDGALVGAAWRQEGQFTCLDWQPREGDLVFQYAAVTVYQRDAAEEVFHAITISASFDGFVERLPSLGLRAVPMEAA